MNRCFLLFLSMAFSMDLPAAEPSSPEKIADLEYAIVDGRSLKLDLYLPPPAEKASPLIVWVHGGAWRAGSKADMPLGELVAQGYAVASVDYRLTTIAPFPALIHDIKGAIRFLRSQAEKYRLDPERFAVAGSSAGGHLAALVGVTNGHAELEGKVGGHGDQSSRVSAIISLFGASNLRTILAQSTPHGLKVRIPALQLLLGGQPEEQGELAKLASPVEHVDEHDPPLLLIHGDQDPQMPINQSHELYGRYQALGLTATFEVVYNSAHGGPAFYDERRMKLMRAFLDLHLRRESE